MKDWNNLEADVNYILTKHFSKGRSGRNVEFVVIHYNAGNLTIEGCYSVWQVREASAHYQVESGGRIGQLVWDADTAWHAGDWDANCRSIGIEHANQSDGTVTSACLDNGAHLVAAICKHFGLGRPEWGVNVFPHSHFSATSCPGQLYGSQKNVYIQQAQKWYDQMVNGGAAPSAPSISSNLTLIEDGWWGVDTTTEIQKQGGTPVDGEIWGQNKYWKPYLKGCTGGWKWHTGSAVTGSTAIKKVQTTLRDKYGKDPGSIDGIFGEKSWKAMEQAAGYVPDDGFDSPSNTVKWLQNKLNNHDFF